MKGADRDHRHLQHTATGALDPFSYVKPKAAAILADFIVTFFSGVLGPADDPDSYGLRHKVRTGLRLPRRVDLIADGRSPVEVAGRLDPRRGFPSSPLTGYRA